MVVAGEMDVRKTYGETLLKLGKADARIVVLEADLMKASGSAVFREAFPERHFQVGISEQNLIGVAAGLAAMGNIPFASTFSSFLSQRGCDQIVNSVAFNKFNVKLCGIYSGLTQEKNGGTHIGIEDISIFRCMPNMVVIDPGDCVELSQTLEFAAAYEGPVYIRIARGPMQTIFPDNYEFHFGRAIVLEDGMDVSMITAGITTMEGKWALDSIKDMGLSVRHIHMPTLKPVDREEIIRAARETGAIITVENHSRFGGLGSIVAEVVCEECPVPVKRLGINDRFGETASLRWLMDRFGISFPNIASEIKEMIRLKK
jgi:transketolase